jgi:hypothetical protein
MKGTMIDSALAKPAVERLSDAQVSRPPAFFAASVAAVSAGTLVYRLLRSGEEEGDAT